MNMLKLLKLGFFSLLISWITISPLKAEITYSCDKDAELCSVDDKKSGQIINCPSQGLRRTLNYLCLPFINEDLDKEPFNLKGLYPENTLRSKVSKKNSKITISILDLNFFIEKEKNKLIVSSSTNRAFWKNNDLRARKIVAPDESHLWVKKMRQFSLANKTKDCRYFSEKASDLLSLIYGFKTFIAVGMNHDGGFHQWLMVEGSSRNLHSFDPLTNIDDKSLFFKPRDNFFFTISGIEEIDFVNFIKLSLNQNYLSLKRKVSSQQENKSKEL